jgi:hypothetical protein
MARYPNTYEVRVLQERITLHRACFGADSLSVLAGLRSNFENRRDPPHPADLHATILHMAVSMFEKADTIERLARRHPARIGTHLMSLTLQPGHGVCVADTSGPGHWSVWGVPAQLQAFVTGVRRVS